MAYVYVSSLGIKNTPNARWVQEDVSNIALPVLYSQYRKLYLKLTEPVTNNLVYVTLESFLDNYSLFTGSVNDLLILNGLNTLQTVNDFPTINPKYAYFSDAFLAGYKVETLARDTGYNINLPKHLKTDLRISRPNSNTSMQDVFDHCLVSVNGFFHLTDTDSNYLYVFDGGKSCYVSKQNQIGILSFKNISKVHSIAIKDEMIFGSKDDSDIYTRAYINTNMDISNKYVFLVLGGYLIRMEKDILFKVSEKNICVDLSRLNLLNRFYESMNVVDYSSLGLDLSSNNIEKISIQQFLSPVVIRKYLTLPTSFIVVVDKEDLFFNKYNVKQRKVPFMLETFSEPKYPLFLGNDRIAEYWWTKENGVYNLTVQNAAYQNKVFDSVVSKNNMIVNNNNLPFRQVKTNNPYFLEIGCDV